MRGTNAHRDNNECSDILYVIVYWWVNKYLLKAFMYILGNCIIHAPTLLGIYDQ